MRSALASLRPLLVATLTVAAVLARPAVAQEDPALSPYVMLRSLQFVQDSVVLGDHSAGEMQRFMLEKIDQRLRNVDMTVFEDTRNVDAALIYAMSGGNPATLEYLVARDVAGAFDNRLADALRKYLSGQGTLVTDRLGDLAREYRDQKIGAYLALVSGNVTIQNDPQAALVFYDWARLASPGTIVEEAALRRSVAIAVEADLVSQGLAYSRKYARRFVHSPYASQFVDFFVQLVVEHFPQIGEADLDGTVAGMDVDRRREVYLRIARHAAVEGKNELAMLASSRAAGLSDDDADPPAVRARLYGGMAGISTPGIDAPMEDLAEIPDERLSPRDQALHRAARAIAAEVLRPPSAESLGQGTHDTFMSGSDGADAVAPPGHDVAGSAASGDVRVSGSAVEIDPDFRNFVESGRSKLGAIDALLREEGVSQ